MTAAFDILSKMNDVVLTDGGVDTEGLQKALCVSAPKYVIELPGSISLLNCRAFDDHLGGSIVYDFGERRSILFIVEDEQHAICDLWPEMLGVAPTISRSPGSPNGCNVVYRSGGLIFGAGFDDVSKMICIFFSKEERR